jgi:hypothetical protein
MTGGSVSATGNVTGNYILGNGVSLTGVITSVANINNGTSNVAITAANANVTVSVNGTSNVAVFSNTGAYVTGVVSASGNITGSNANIVTDLTVGNSIVLNGVGGYGTVTTTQFSSVFAKANGLNATSLMQVKGNDGTNGMGMRAVTGSSALIYSNAAIELRVGSTIRDLDTPTGGNIIATIASTGLTVNGVASASGNVTGGNVLTDGLITATGNVTGNYILGNGSQLSGIATNSINSGNSNVVVNGTDGNVTIGINGVANTVEVSPGELTVYGVYSNPKTISSNVVIGPNINSMLIGPIAVDPAGNIFVPTGSTLNII